MTKEEARIVLLEQALSQAICTIRFLDGCLREPGMYKYGYPDQTERHLDEMLELVGEPQLCFHSMDVLDCPSCQDRVKRFRDRDEAEKVLGICQSNVQNAEDSVGQ